MGVDPVLISKTNLIKGPGLTRVIRMAVLVSSCNHPRGVPSLLRPQDLVEREVSLAEGAAAIEAMDGGSPLGITMVTKFV